MITIISGFFASMAHVVTGPDHLAAVTPLVIESRKRSWKIGLWWGAGHTCGMLLTGLLILFLRGHINLEFISRKSDLIIGFLLTGIGCWAIARIFIHHKHGHIPHPHVHTRPFTFAHIHAHSHQKAEKQEHDHEHIHKNRQNTIMAFAVGVVHGLAGFSHLLAILPSLALPTQHETIAYLAAFAVGTICTMTAYAFLMGILVKRSGGNDHPAVIRGFTIGGGMLAIVVGIWWLIRAF